MLVFDGYTPPYVARFPFAGVILGLIVPYLYLMGTSINTAFSAFPWRNPLIYRDANSEISH